jgi:enoyl-CoA hydratase/carnithine racemase
MEVIRYEVMDPVAVITLNRPEVLNALTFPMLEEFRRAVKDAEHDRAVVGIVVTGAGRGFCSGLDMNVLSDAVVGNNRRQQAADEIPGMFTWLMAVDKPVIAAVNGVAAGAGFVLAVMSDLRVVSTDGSFTTVFSKRGLVAEHGATWILPRLVGTSRALDLLWSSRRIDAHEAYRIGLADALVEPSELVATAAQYIRDLAEQVSPASLRDTKRLVYAHLGAGYPEALREIERVQNAALDRVDAAEGVTALVERRPPLFPRLGS